MSASISRKPLIAKANVMIEDLGLVKSGTGSSEYKIILLSLEINSLSFHIKKHNKDFCAKRSLLILVARRKALISYLERHNPTSLAKVFVKLNIRNTAKQSVGGTAAKIA